MKKIILFTLFSLTMTTYAQTPTFYEPVLTGAMAARIAKASFDEADKSGALITVTIVDKSGEILAVQRHHNSGAHTVTASFKKAFTACSQQRETAVIHAGVKNGTIPEDIRYLNENISIMDGGLPIFIDKIIVGGIGVGGAHGDNDVRIAKAGLLALLK